MSRGGQTVDLRQCQVSIQQRYLLKQVHFMRPWIKWINKLQEPCYRKCQSISRNVVFIIKVFRRFNPTPFVVNEDFFLI